MRSIGLKKNHENGRTTVLFLMAMILAVCWSISTILAINLWELPLSPSSKAAVQKRSQTALTSTERQNLIDLWEKNIKKEKLPLSQNSLIDLISKFTGQEHLPSYVWENGKPFQPNNPSVHTRQTSNSLVFDALSIGSNYKLDLLDTQIKTWANHSSIRYMLATTEDDDHDPDCHLVLQREEMFNVARRCAKEGFGGKKSPFHAARNYFPRPKYLEKENKTGGWLCAQQRFARSLGKIGRFYRHAVKGVDLPNYLLIQDDDTYYDIDNLMRHVRAMHSDCEAPFATGGCIITWPTSAIQFSFPQVGFGTVISRGTLRLLLRPLYCNNTHYQDENEEEVCRKIQLSYVGEKTVFENGMSISDIMDALSKRFPYRSTRLWKNRGGSYCMMGDWTIGYFVNFYDLAPAPDAKYAQNRWDTSLGRNRRVGPKGQCKNDQFESCKQDSDLIVCHWLDSEKMLSIHKSIAK